MERWARAMTAALIIGATGLPSACRAAEARPNACLSPGDTRETLQSQKLVQPYRAMAEASRGTEGESISIKLCRLKAEMVYEVTILRHDGHLVHVLVDASNGALIAPHAGP
jgi:hypothetical protein